MVAPEVKSAKERIPVIFGGPVKANRTELFAPKDIFFRHWDIELLKDGGIEPNFKNLNAKARDLYGSDPEAFKAVYRRAREVFKGVANNDALLVTKRLIDPNAVAIDPAIDGFTIENIIDSFV